MKNEEVSDSMKASTCIRFFSDFKGLNPSPPIFALRGNNVLPLVKRRNVLVQEVCESDGGT